MQQLRRTGGIRVDIAGDIQPLLPGPVQNFQRTADDVVPIALADGLEMADVHRHLQRPGHLHHLLQRRKHPVALLAHMDRDGNAGAPHRRKGADELLRRVEALRRVAQAQGDAQSSSCQRSLQLAVDLIVRDISSRSVS